MSRRLGVSLAAPAAALVAIVVTTVAGQAEVRRAEKAKTITAMPGVPPRAVDGQPDLQGVRGSDSVTPLQRPRAR